MAEHLCNIRLYNIQTDSGSHRYFLSSAVPAPLLTVCVCVWDEGLMEKFVIRAQLKAPNHRSFWRAYCCRGRQNRTITRVYRRDSPAQIAGSRHSSLSQCVAERWKPYGVPLIATHRGRYASAEFRASEPSARLWRPKHLKGKFLALMKI